MKQVHIFVLGFLLHFVVMLISPGNAAAQTAPTFVGVRTFLSAPYEPDLDNLKTDFAVLGCRLMKARGDSRASAMVRGTCARIPRSTRTI